MESVAFKSLKDLLIKDAKFRIYILAAIAAALVLYFRAFSYPFVNFDDNVYVYENPLIFNFTLENIKFFFTEFFYGGYYPLTMLSFMLDYQLFGAEASGFHKMNFIFYVLTFILLGQFLYNLFKQKVFWVLPLLLFAVHPLHIESVAWISERKDVLYGFFYFAALSFSFFLTNLLLSS
jgi:hypothetical protein